MLATFLAAKRLLTLRQCGISTAAKLILRRNAVTSATSFQERSVLAASVLTLDVPGAVIECGSYQGSSTVALSLACARARRKLIVCDSFEGLPAPNANDKCHMLPREEQTEHYQQGAWRGTLEQVRQNVTRFGDISVCTFVRGYFESSLPSLHADIAMAFCDVDLISSLQTCLKYIWPLMPDGGKVFTHEAHHQEIAALFYDMNWWRSEIGDDPPGLIGAGSGIGLVPMNDGTWGSCLGYTIKHPRVKSQVVGPDAHHRQVVLVGRK